MVVEIQSPISALRDISIDVAGTVCGHTIPFILLVTKFAN